MRLLTISLWLLVCGIFSACGRPSSSGKPDANAQPKGDAAASIPATKPPRTLGQLVPVEPVAGTTDGSYAYYAPADYNVDHPIPLIIFFDSHARGKDPVGMYQSLAERYGILLVGSNTSKNGQQPQQGLQIYDELIKDLRLKFAIDELRITISGFSGGARVAANIAQSRPVVKNVIACSAGFQPRQSDQFNYYAIVGKKDFNYQELRKLEEVLDDTPQRHIVAYWDGGHEWPSVDVMADAFDFVAFRGMEKGQEKLDSLVADAKARFEKKVKSIPKDEVSLTEWQLHKDIIAKLDGLADMTKEKNALDKIVNSTVYRSAQDGENHRAGFESALRDSYVPLIGTESVDEWRKLVARLNPKNKPMDSRTLFMNQRVLNFVSLNVYFQVDGALKAGDLAAAEHFLQIYALVDPPNPEHAYLTAHVRIRQSRPTEALAALQQAKLLGFKDADRMAADPALVALRSDPTFVKLLEEMRAM